MNDTPSDVSARLYAAIDAKDPDRVGALMADEVRFRFGSAPEVTGRENVRQAARDFLSSLRAIRHRVLQEWIDGDTAIHQMDVTYTRDDEVQMTLPVVNILRLDGDRIRDYRIYVDLGPLFA